MFTPKKIMSDWSLKPHRSGGELVLNARNGDRSTEKGKAAVTSAYNDPILPHSGSGRGKFDGGSGLEAADWRGFKEAGLLDQSLMEKQDTEALVQKISKLEKELYDYQVNMGLLLIEKNKWLSTYEELSQALNEAREILKREQTARLMALSEIEERDENLRKVVANEKQCVANYKKALDAICRESEEMKLTYDKKIAESHALVTRIEEKSLAVEVKLHAADDKFAEVERKSLELEKKLKGMETNAYLLQSERQSLNAEKGMTEVTLSEQREELQEWEESLQKREERQLEGRITLNQREKESNENYSRVEHAKNDLEEAQRKNERISLTLKSNEDDLNIRLAELAKKEEEANAMQKNLERKEKELLALEEKLVAREGVAIQKLYDEHNAIMDLKKHEFEMEMDQKSKVIDEELRNRVAVVELKEAKVSQMEEKIGEREKALEEKLGYYEEKKRDHDSKLKALEAEEKKMEMKKKNMLTDKETLQILSDELDKKRVDLDTEQLKLHSELEILKMSKEERREIQCLESEITQLKDKCALHDELLSKERDALKQYKEEWEVVDEKKAEITHLLNQVNEEKEKLESSKNENLITQDYIRKELEDLEFKKVSFEASMEQERLELSEKLQSDRNHMLHDLELQKRELEQDVQNKLENILLEKERDMEESEQELKKMSEERVMIEKKIQEMATSKQQLEGQQLEIRKNIEKLNILVNKLKAQSKEIQEFLNKHDKCKNCGEALSGLHGSLNESTEVKAVEVPEVSKSVDDEPMRGVRRTSSVKAVIDEAKGILGETLEPSETTTTGVEDLDSSEAPSVSVPRRGSRKRQQTGSQTPIKKQYNLRQRKS